MSQLRLLLGYSLVLALLLGGGGQDGGGLGAAAAGFAYWFAHVALGLGLMMALTAWLSRTRVAQWSQWVALLLAALLGALLFTPVALLLEYVAGRLGDSASDFPTVGSFFDLPVVAAEFQELVLPFVASWLLLNFGYQRFMVEQDDRPDPAAENSAVTDPVLADLTRSANATIFDRLPAGLGRDLVKMTADLNYVHVVTCNGRVMVLYSLRQAAEDAAATGMLVHRSHWVAYAAVERVKRSGNSLQIALSDGSTVPVSRRRQRLVLEHYGDDYVREGSAVGPG
ncbi:MAG: LytTR family DNA-binding domain-containing protein [Pseudomonadales bacterium]